MMNKYFISDYFQKSKHFLFPLITEKEQEGLLNTYLFADYLKEDIVDYFLLCEIEKDTELNMDLEKYLYTTYDTLDNTEVYVFDLSSLSEEIDKFLTGSYSDYCKTSKNKILKYFGWKPNPEGAKTYREDDKNIYLHFYVILYPNDFRNEYSKGLFTAKINGKTLFDTEEEVLKIVKDMKELCPIYDVVKETFTKQIKQ